MIRKKLWKSATAIFMACALVTGASRTALAETRGGVGNGRV